jgi:exonuclease SbcD
VQQLDLLHFSDLHLGVETYSRYDPETGLPSRLADTLRALDEVVDVALQEQVDLVLFTGDMYKNREPTPTHQRELAKRVRRLLEGGVPLFLLVGNHDLPNSPTRAHSIEVFEALGLPGLTVAAEPKLYRLETRSGPLQVMALPWIPRSRLMSTPERGLTVPELNRRIAELISCLLAAVEIDPTVPAVLAGHARLAGAEFGSERATVLGQDYELSLGDLSPDRFAYLALGHMHKHQVLRRHRPPVVYAGSLVCADFGEEGEVKGYVRVTIQPGADVPFEAQWRFVPIQHARRFLTITLDAREATDPTAQVVKALEARAAELRDAIVRLEVKLSPENERQFRYPEVQRALRSAHYVAGIRREVERHHRQKLAGQRVEELSPRDALELYLKSRQVSPERRQELLRFADRLLGQEGVAEPPQASSEPVAADS